MGQTATCSGLQGHHGSQFIAGVHSEPTVGEARSLKPQPGCHTNVQLMGSTEASMKIIVSASCARACLHVWGALRAGGGRLVCRVVDHGRPAGLNCVFNILWSESSMRVRGLQYVGCWCYS